MEGKRILGQAAKQGACFGRADMQVQLMLAAPVEQGQGKRSVRGYEHQAIRPAYARQLADPGQVRFERQVAEHGERHHQVDAPVGQGQRRLDLVHEVAAAKVLLAPRDAPGLHVGPEAVSSGHRHGEPARQAAAPAPEVVRLAHLSKRAVRKQGPEFGPPAENRPPTWRGARVPWGRRTRSAGAIPAAPAGRTAPAGPGYSSTPQTASHLQKFHARPDPDRASLRSWRPSCT